MHESVSLGAVPNQACTLDNPCPKCSLILIIRDRFAAFRAKFGREPMPEDAIFFDPSRDTPAKASLLEALKQVEAAATAVGIKAEPVVRFLKIDSAISQAPIGHPIGANFQRPASAGRLKSNTSVEPRSPSVGNSAWKRFADNKRLQQLNNITREELRTLSGIAMMGEVRNSQDFLFILKQIRKAGL